VGTIAVLKDAMAKNVATRIAYYTAGRDAVTERLIEPYGLVDHGGVWYVVAYCRLRRAELPFRVDRIREVSLTQEEYLVPDDFSIERYRRPEMYVDTGEETTVRVRFSPAVAERIRESTPRRDLEEGPKGELVRTFRTGPRARWLYALVARYGRDAEVLSPPEHRAGMAAYLDEVVLPDSVAASRAAAAARPRPSESPRAARRPSRPS
jgi:predicted DNA-binding transcriptional regulator YafY